MKSMILRLNIMIECYRREFVFIMVIEYELKALCRVFISCAVLSICGRGKTGGAKFGVGVKETVKVPL